jgi:hypothetical protein
MKKYTIAGFVIGAFVFCVAGAAVAALTTTPQDSTNLDSSTGVIRISNAIRLRNQVPLQRVDIEGQIRLPGDAQTNVNKGAGPAHTNARPRP